VRTLRFFLLFLLAFSELSCVTREEKLQVNDIDSNQIHKGNPNVSKENTSSSNEMTKEDRERQEFVEAEKTPDRAERLTDLCLSKKNDLACGAFYVSCERKIAEGCFFVAELIHLRQNLAEKEVGENYLLYISKACLYGNKEACSRKRKYIKSKKLADALLAKEQKRLNDEEQLENRRLARINRVNNSVECGMTFAGVSKVLGKPETDEACTDHIHEAFKYGRRWVFFRGGGAFLVMDHDDYHGVCLDNSTQYPSGFTGWFICKESH
jgi:hypothetical protein